MSGTKPSHFVDAAKALAPRIQASAEENERTRRQSLPLALIANSIDGTRIRPSEQPSSPVRFHGPTRRAGALTYL